MRYLFALLMAFSIATPASAAGYVEYVFRTLVTGTTYNYATGTFDPVTPYDRFFTFIVPLDGTYGTLTQFADNARFETGSNYFNGSGYSIAAVNGSGFGFYSYGDNPSGYGTISIGVCTTPTPANEFTATFTPFTCGSFSLFNLAHGGRDDLSGQLIGFNARLRDGSAPFVGFADGAAFAVPETGTWMMLILGFGMVGVAMRLPRRRASMALKLNDRAVC